MKYVDPTYDAETGTWFHDGCEAPTVRELLRLLGRKYHGRVEMRDYYPKGAPPTVWSKVGQQRVHAPTSMRRVGFVRPRKTTIKSGSEATTDVAVVGGGVGGVHPTGANATLRDRALGGIRGLLVATRRALGDRG
jgi:hypothetical protein